MIRLWSFLLFLIIWQFGEILILFCFGHEMDVEFCHVFTFLSLEMVTFFYIIYQCVWWIIIFDFENLIKPYSPGIINSIWSWGILLFINYCVWYAYIFLGIFASLLYKYDCRVHKLSPELNSDPEYEIWFILSHCCSS